ncbi:hypothetical protein D3C73_1591610 [compost metagenome]
MEFGGIAWQTTNKLGGLINLFEDVFEAAVVHGELGAVDKRFGLQLEVVPV